MKITQEVTKTDVMLWLTTLLLLDDLLTASSPFLFITFSRAWYVNRAQGKREPVTVSWLAGVCSSSVLGWCRRRSRSRAFGMFVSLRSLRVLLRVSLRSQVLFSMFTLQLVCYTFYNYRTDRLSGHRNLLTDWLILHRLSASLPSSEGSAFGPMCGVSDLVAGLPSDISPDMAIESDLLIVGSPAVHLLA